MQDHRTQLYFCYFMIGSHLSVFKRRYQLINQTIQQTIRIIFYMQNTSSTAGDSPKCGCFAVQAQPMKDSAPLPVLESLYDVQIINGLADITLTQKYINTGSKFIEVEYNFPVNPNACIYRFTADFGNRIVEGVVKEKQAAKKEFQKAVKAGKQASLGTLSEDSGDVFCLRIGNVAPGKTVQIHISFLQELSLVFSTLYELRIMSTVSPSFLKTLSNKQVLKGFRSEAARSEGKFYWDFKVSINSSRKITFFECQEHGLNLLSHNDSRTEMKFSLAKPGRITEDFILVYTMAEAQLPCSVFGRTDAGCAAMVSFVPKFCQLSVSDAYSASLKGKSFEPDFSQAKGEYIFLLDRSGSMSGESIEKAKQALILFVKSLPNDSLFNIVSFGSGFQRMFRNRKQYNNKSAEEAIGSISSMDANMEGTEILCPLEIELKSKMTQGYTRHIFLLTDGGVPNTEEVIKTIGNHCRDGMIRVHTIGIGSGASQKLIKDCALRGGGHHAFVTNQQDPSEKIIGLLSDSLSPVITKLKVDFNKHLVESIVPNPQRLPCILKNQAVNFFINFKHQLQKPQIITFQYRDSINDRLFRSELIVDPQGASCSMVSKMGQFLKIRLMEQWEGDNLENCLYNAKAMTKEGIVAESVKHQILSKHTSFICVEKEVVDGKYQEISDIGQMTIKINRVKKLSKQQIDKSGTRQIMLELMQKNELIEQALKNMQCLCEQQTLHVYSASFKLGCAKEGKKSGISNPFKGLFSSVGGFFKRLISKQDSPPKSKQKYASKKEVPPKEVAQSKDIKMNQDSSQSSKNASISINDLVAKQDTGGFWKDISILGKLFSPQIQKMVEKEGQCTIVMTYLIAKWIEVNYPQKQYSLIVKKAFDYCLKNAQKFQNYPALYDSYVQRP